MHQDVLECIINHVFLPPKLPTEHDGDDYQKPLLNLLASSLSDFAANCSGQHSKVVSDAVVAIKEFKSIMDSKGNIDKSKLHALLKRLAVKDTFCVPLYIKAQNAAILIRKANSSVQFHMWELSPDNESVLGTTGRLIRFFPDVGVSIPAEKIKESNFLAFLADAIATMSIQEAKDMKMQASTHGAADERDTTSPALVTELLYGYLMSMEGSSLIADGVWKCTREEVVWARGCKLPWRRSPFWLFLRVTLHLAIGSLTGQRTILYKKAIAFFMSRILTESVKEGLESNIVHCMVMKISGRVHNKLDLTVEEAWMSIVHDALSAARHFHDELPSLDFSHVDIKYKDFNLFQFELWVAKHLDDWIEKHAIDADACSRLRELSKNYFDIASSCGKQNPEQVSLMVLAILELWVACDRSAVIHNNQLALFSPEISVDIWGPLLLRSKENMERLHKAENYLAARDQAATSGTAIFDSFGTKKSFAVKSFNANEKYQDDLERIKMTAQRSRDAKIEELSMKKERFNSKMAVYSNTSCDLDNIAIDDPSEARHSASCNRCQHKLEAYKLDIDRFEWPLPSDLDEEKAVIFELSPPPSFQAWRDFTLFFLSNVLRESNEEDNKSKSSGTGLCLDAYANENGWAIGGSPYMINSRITVKSDVKKSHRPLKISSDIQKEEIFVENTRRWRYVDQLARTNLHKRPTTALSQLCTVQLFSYADIFQSFIHQSRQQSAARLANTAITNSSKCPAMSTQEYRSLALLPQGQRTTWLDILQHLAMPKVDFKKPETALIMLQKSIQAGTAASNAVREAHALLECPVFTETLLAKIDQTVDRVQDNWDSCTSLYILITLIIRALSIGHSNVRAKLLHCLSKCRKISRRWTTDLHNRFIAENESPQRTKFILKCVETALICVETFNLDETMLDATLNNDHDAATLLKCSSLISDNTLDISHTHQLNTILKFNWKRIMFKSHKTLLNRVTRSGFLDDVLLRSCSGTLTSWTPEAGYWVKSSRSFHEGSSHSMLQFNLLTAEVFIDGVPIGKLPNDVESHSQYSTFFGQMRLDVELSSHELGMQYKIVFPIHKYEVALGLSKPSDVGERDFNIIAWRDKRRQDLVPARLFKDRVPPAFSDGYVHWLHEDRRTIELRPAASPWQESPSNWTLQQRGQSWQLVEPSGSVLVNPTSDITVEISTIFLPLASPEDIHVLNDEKGSQLKIRLPKLRLDFTVKYDTYRIMSEQFPGMFVDSNQNIETLIGLQNILTLARDNGDRMIIIPEGDVRFKCVNIATRNQHVRVTIEVGQSSNFYTYDVDKNLEQLVGETLQSRLNLAYLHALTSYCVPDPFTKHTGTEQALDIIHSGEVRSFENLSPDDHAKLLQIAQLRETRRLSQPLAGKLQVVSWVDGLSALSHHYDFRTAVQHIFDQSTKYAFFHPDDYVEPPNLENTEPVDLDQRNAIRSLTFCIAGYEAAVYSKSDDKEYGHLQRRQPESSKQDEIDEDDSDSELGEEWEDRLGNVQPLTSRCRRVFKTCCATRPNWLENYHNYFKSAHSSRVFASKVIKLLRGTSTTVTAGPMKNTGQFDFNYDASWLDDPSILFPGTWFQIIQSLRKRPFSTNRYKFRFFLAALSFSRYPCAEGIQILAKTMHDPIDPQPLIPQVDGFYLNKGYKPKKKDVEQIVSNAIITFAKSAYSQGHRRVGESRHTILSRQQKKHGYAKVKCQMLLPDELIKQWGGKEEVQWPEDLNKFKKIVDVSKLMSSIKSHFRAVEDNEQLRRHFAQWHVELSSTSRQCAPYPDECPRRPYEPRNKRQRVDIFTQNSAPLAEPRRTYNLSDWTRPVKAQFNPELQSLVEILRNKSNSSQQKKYAENLHQSSVALKEAVVGHEILRSGPELRTLLPTFICSARFDLDRYMNTIRRALGCIPARSGSNLHMLRAIAQIPRLPRVGTRFLLQQLKRLELLSPEWKACLVRYADDLSQLQLWERIYRAATQSPGDLEKELTSLQPRNWDPFVHPDWLIFEVENNLRVRNVQAEIAQAMMHPPQNGNTVMQLNMGEGKSSVIVPIIAASLADGENLVRIIVAKPQSRQMADILTRRLGGILDRKVYYLPFSRSVSMNEAAAHQLYAMLQECVANKGVLIIQPEQDLSLQLMILDCFISAKRSSIGEILVSIRQLFDNKTRDIIDESDEIFCPKYELVYPLGTPQPVDFSLGRCHIIQSMLSMVADVAVSVQIEVPDGISISFLDGRYPRIQIFTEEASKLLNKKVGEKICQSGLAELPVHRLEEQLKREILTYITQRAPPDESVLLVRTKIESWDLDKKNTLNLVRGILAHGCVSTALKHRWRVNYGLDKLRHPKTDLAVPYRAKDTPSLRSEYSYADTTITKTCISYYHEGLKYAEFQSAMEHLLKSEQPHIEYSVWVKDTPNLKPSFHYLESVNLHDKEQCESYIFPHLRFSRACINYFLACKVFPRQLREHSEKISASGWDLARHKTLPTTGFSGTHDSRHLLPLSIEQHDLDTQKHTDALVLNNILSPHNSILCLGENQMTNSSIAEEFLIRMSVEKPQIRVILDVGAHVIELGNEQVARKWLGLVRQRDDVFGAIFCNEKDELTVLDKDGQLQCLRLSPLANQLHKCVVYLDEAHTRGIDLKFPSQYRAAVTLGKDLTKDRLAQACMRMRELGKGQSVTFCVPHEIENRIREFQELTLEEDISALHVVLWTIEQTFAETSRLMPNWARQGGRHEREAELWDRARSGNTINMTKDLAKQFREDAVLTIEAQYQIRPSPNSTSDSADNDGKISRIHQRVRDLGYRLDGGQELQEEQEREMEQEIEEERALELPSPPQPGRHEVHEDVVKFVKTGEIVPCSKGIVGAFQSLSNTAAATQFNVIQFPQSLKVTKDFANVLKAAQRPTKEKSDLYKRDVQYILTTADQDHIVQDMVIISPFEAQSLYAEIERSEIVTLHIYSARQNCTYAAVDDLDLYVVPQTTRRRIPTQLRIALNLFAGQLYFETFKEYTEVCEYLGLSWTSETNGVENDGFIRRRPGARKSPHGLNSKASPVPFLKAFMTDVRNFGGNIDKTHMGKMLNGAILTEADFPSRRKRKREDDGAEEGSLFVKQE
ncbi:hypothetical protein QQS21_002673 [Conoideocrella luteorostrata]|uniref:ubiquitinyl hydrolase 1 n=1 Tax=Conoideocrella luteorostrata TaxID=1105319 RepID=A0AAJ0CUR5_9HYPO|nr:hypothetical protein QQS21_002673 [Conoideocrella luteorostrata]